MRLGELVASEFTKSWYIEGDNTTDNSSSLPSEEEKQARYNNIISKGREPDYSLCDQTAGAVYGVKKRVLFGTTHQLYNPVA